MQFGGFNVHLFTENARVHEIQVTEQTQVVSFSELSFVVDINGEIVRGIGEGLAGDVAESIALRTSRSSAEGIARRQSQPNEELVWQGFSERLDIFIDAQAHLENNTFVQRGASAAEISQFEVVLASEKKGESVPFVSLSLSMMRS
eukprot:IDg20833t1